MKVETMNGFSDSSDVKGSAQDVTRAWIMISCAWAFYLYEYILRVSPSVMTSELMLDFGVTAGALGLLTSFYYLAYVPLQIPCGLITDRIGPRKVITFSAALCVVGSVMFAYSDGIAVAQMGRFLMGAGSACAYISCSKIGAEWFSSTKFAMITGITMMMGTFGGSFGGRPFAMMSNAFGWRYSMLIAAVVGIGIVFMAWFVIRDYPKHREKTRKVVKSADLWEGLRIIVRNPQNWLIGLYGCIMYLPLSAFAELWGVPFLMAKYGISNELASTACTMVLIGMGLGSAVSAWCSDQLRSRTKVMSAAMIGTFICFSLAIYTPNLPLSLMFPLLFIAGLISGGQILYFAATKENCPDNIAATVVGFTNCFVMLSGFIFQPLLGKALDFFWDGQMLANGTPLYSVKTYEMSMSIVCVALLMGCILIRFIKDTYPKDVD